MNQYNLNVKLSNSQRNKLKSAMKNETEVVSRLSSNMIGNSDDETIFPHKLLLTYRQVANLCEAATSGRISIASFATVIGALVGIASASFSFAFSLNTGIVKKILKTTQNKKKKHNKIIMLAGSKLNSIENNIKSVNR